MNEKPTILFVDDEERILRSLKILFMTRYNVLTTTDGYEALKIVEQDKVHVVVSDQRMPIMLGSDLLRQVKAIAPYTIRLLLTGYSDLQAVIDSVNDGEIFRYINKPWQTQEIKATVAKAVDIALRLEKTKVSSTPTPSPPTEKIPQATVNKNAVEDNMSTGHLHLLVLDSDENIFHAISKLSNNNYVTHWARTLDEALHILDVQKIAFMVSDVQLNGEDISASIKILKEYNPNILAIILTAFQDTKTLIGLINQGQIYRFLPKPVHENLLAKSLTAAMRHYQTLQTTPELLICHTVEKVSEEVGHKVEHKLAGGVLSFIGKIRGQIKTPNR